MGLLGLPERATGSVPLERPIREAVAATRWYCANEWRVSEPELGMVSFIDEARFAGTRPGPLLPEGRLRSALGADGDEDLAVVQATPRSHAAGGGSVGAQRTFWGGLKTLRAPFHGSAGRAGRLISSGRRLETCRTTWSRSSDPGRSSSAVPEKPGTETVNDIDGYISNFWRSVQRDPELVAHYATGR